MLHLDRFFGRQEDFVAIDRRLKFDTLLRQLAHSRQREDLEAARIREYRFVPVHEFVQAAVLSHDLGTRPQHEVKSVAENDLSAVCRNLLRRDALDGPVRAYRHEGRRPHITTAKFQRATARRSASFGDLKLHGEFSGVRNIASP